MCVLEAGPRDWHPYIHIPAGFIKLFHQPGLNWLYTQEPSEWTGGRRILAPRGKTLGGSSSINGHIYNRGQRLDYDGWAQRGNRGWGYADVLPYFKRLERRIGEGDETFRGREGGITVTDIDQHHPLCEAFIAGAVSLGIPRNPDYNGESQLGINYAQRAILNGRRISAARAFLHPAMKRHEPRRAHARARDRPDLRGQARGRRALPQGRPRRRAGRSPRAPRGDPVGRHVQFAAAAADVRRRRAGASAVARHRRAPRAARRRREPARSLRAARLGAREEHATRSTSARAASISRPRSPNGVSAERAFSGSRRRRSTASGNPTPHLETSDIQLTFTPASYREGMQGQLETRARHDVRAVAAAARKARAMCASGRPIRSSSRKSSRTISPRRPTAACWSPRCGSRAAPEVEAARAVLRLRGFSRRRGAERRRNARRREGARHHHVPPDGHLPHGAGQRSDQRGRRSSCACAGSRACASSTPRSCR